MENIIRLAKSGSDWGSNELAAYNVDVVGLSAPIFGICFHTSLQVQRLRDTQSPAIPLLPNMKLSPDNSLRSSIVSPIRSSHGWPPVGLLCDSA